MLLYIMMISWFSFILCILARGEKFFLLAHLRLCINFFKSEFCLAEHFFLGLFCYTMCMSVSLPSDKLLQLEELYYSLLQPQRLQSVRSRVFGQRQFWCQQTCKTLLIVPCHSEQYVECLLFPYSIILFSFYISCSSLHQP